MEPVSNVFYLVEGFALVMLCNCRLYPRRLSVHILREVKTLIKSLGCCEDEQPVIDVVDRCCPQVMEKCLGMLPPAEKAAALSISNVDLQWIADRSSCIWTAGFQDENSTKSSSSLNLNGVDPWSTCLFGFLERDRVLTLCPSAVMHSWPIVYGRVNSLFTVVDPTPVNDNRASLLRGSTTVKKPVNERDIYMHVWKNYVTFAFRVVPPVPSPIVRCASPDLSLRGTRVDCLVFAILVFVSSANLNSGARECLLRKIVLPTTDETVASDSGSPMKLNVLSDSIENLLLHTQSLGRIAVPQSKNRHKRSSSSPDSLTTERNDNKSPGGNVSPTGLYKLVVPLLRCETVDVRDAAVHALGKVNSDALKDLMEELVIYIREAVDRKQENMRRRRRRDALRLQLVRVFELVAEYGTFGISPCVLDRDTQSLHPTFVEYIDGARLYLENEADKEVPAVRDIKLHFCNFIRKMIKSFSLETCVTLLKRDLRRNLFTLFAGWSGRFGRPLGHQTLGQDMDERPCSELQLSALQAMSALLCCGSCFNPQGLAEDGVFYPWLDMLLASRDEKVRHNSFYAVRKAGSSKERYLLIVSHVTTTSVLVGTPKLSSPSSTLPALYPGGGWVSRMSSTVCVTCCLFSLYRSLGYGTTSFDGEIIAISECLRNLLCHINKFRNAVILSDSKAAILSIVSKHTPSSQTAEITKMLSQLISLNKRIVFQWIPSHCGILGNENADALAKKGSTATYRPVTKSTYYSVKRFIKSTYLDFNKQNLITQSQGKKWKTLHQNPQLIPDVPRKSSVAACRLATGRDCLAKHLHRIGIYQSPNCPLCNSNQEMDSEHLKICASVAGHDNIFEKYWSARDEVKEYIHSKGVEEESSDDTLEGSVTVSRSISYARVRPKLQRWRQKNPESRKRGKRKIRRNLHYASDAVKLIVSGLNLGPPSTCKSRSRLKGQKIHR
ncbi:hypothetical protein ANN_14939 [Periplaneta americana]|uniref:RNase H type-1 domain-containing protein n=1 Tax=Periplaneta americana TaxID=6978 RepID=A0ABQ8SXN9_PERAM|nr:hypothetical protein ANN_14939 [Periplaneta americana]